jgi:hypothetical protein
MARRLKQREHEAIVRQTLARVPAAAASSSGPASQLDANGTILDVNAITDGEVLKRVGTTIVSTPLGSPSAHHLTHENGGADEISVAGLSGLLADPQTPLSHDIVAVHTTSGRTAGQVLRASAAAVFAWSLLAFADLTATPTTVAGYGITDAYTKTQSDANYAPIVHTHAAADIVSGQLGLARGGTGVDGSGGLSANFVFAAPSGGAGAASFRALVSADLPSHDIIAKHSASGLTAGQVIRASGAATFAWSALAFADLSSPPTTLAGYGITDAYTKVAADARYAPIVHTHAAADIISGALALARGGTGLDGSTGNAINLVFASPGSGGAGALSLRALVAGDIPNHDTAKITTGRFTAARMLDGTNGFALLGKGAGVDPAYGSLVTTRLTADNAAIAAAVPTTALQVANLTQAANIGEEWDIEWIIDIANSIAADVFVFNVTSTAGTLTGRYVVYGANGVPNTGAAVAKCWQMPAGTITVANANAPGATGTIGLVCTVVIRARVKLTVANGTIQLLLRAGTNAAASSGTATVKAQSQMSATRIA